MKIHKELILEAIKNRRTLIAEHRYCETITDLLTVEVWPYRLDGDFLVCHDIKADQPYAINLGYVTKMQFGEARDIILPQRSVPE